MRASIFFGTLILGAACVVAFAPNDTLGQGRKGRGSFGGGGFPGGGFGGGGFSGGGASMLMNRDPASIFDMYAKGRSFFLISETRSLQEPLLQYAQKKGITNGQITRDQYMAFHADFKAKLQTAGALPAAPGPGSTPFGGPGGMMMSFGKGKKGFGGPGSMMLPGGAAPNVDVINQQADFFFKRADRNGDGKLNQDEMPGQLRGSLARFDKNNDGLIDESEFREYFLARASGDIDSNSSRGANQIVIDEDELDRRTVVIRAGKLPSNMPEWFEKCDLDSDGQVALSEWRKASKKPLNEFQQWDLNDDGFITPEEALRHQSVLTKDDPKTDRGTRSLAARDPSSGERPSFGGKGKGSFGGMFGGKKGKMGGDPSASPWGGFGGKSGKKGKTRGGQ